MDHTITISAGRVAAPSSLVRLKNPLLGGLLLAICLCTLAGCPSRIVSFNEIGAAALSSDGQTVAYVSSTGRKRMVMLLGHESPEPVDVACQLVWYSFDGDTEEKRVSLPGVRNVLGSYGTARFSPDGRYLAVITRKSLHVVDVTDGTLWLLTDRNETPKSFAWRSPTELGFVTIGKISNWDSTTDRRSWRWRAGTPAEEKEFVLREKKVALRPWSGSGRWSPDGRHVLLRHEMPIELEKGHSHRRLVAHEILDIETGVRRPAIEGDDGYLIGSAAWRPDSSAILSLPGHGSIHQPADLTNPAPAFQAGIVDAASGELTVLDDLLLPLLALPKASVKVDGWTAEGEYILVNAYPQGAMLVDPNAHTIRPVGGPLNPKPGSDEIRRFHFYVLPTPGQLYATTGGGDEAWITDYQGRLIARIDDPSDWYFNHATVVRTPAGLRAVWVDDAWQPTEGRLGRLVVETLKELPPDQSE